MSVVWFDPGAARRAATSWSGWGDQLATTSRATRIRLDEVMMSGWDGGSNDLDYAAEQLWTLSLFTDLLTQRVESADGSFPETVGQMGALWETAVSRTASAAGRRDRLVEEAALVEWLKSIGEADALDYFTERYGSDPAEVLAQLHGAEAVFYFDALNPTQRLALVQVRPELVVLKVLAAGGELSHKEVDRLKVSNAYGVFTTIDAWGVDVSVGLRVISIELAAGVTVVTTKNSDGSVVMTLIEEASVGAGVELDVPRAAEAGGSIGGFGEFQQRFWFVDEASALAGLSTLRHAVQNDVSFGEIGRDAVGVVYNEATEGVRGGVWLANWLIPGGDPVPQLPVYDATPDTVVALRELWLQNGMSEQAGGGVYGKVDAEFEANLGVIEAELDAEAEARLMFYDTDVAEAAPAGTVGQTGVMFAGTVLVDVDGEFAGSPNDQGGHVAASAGFSVDLFQVDDDGTYLTVTLETNVAAGTSLELIDFGAGEIDTTTDATSAMTMSMTVPVNSATTDSVGELGARLARGELPVEEIRELYDAAEVDVTVEAGVSAEAEFEFDGGVVEFEATATSSTSTTVVALHKAEGGEMFSRSQLDELINAAAD